MPYFITDSAPDCSGWATIKDDGEVIGCHANKQDAINQMIAVSIAEGIEPGGERLKHKKMKKIKYRVLPDNYRPSLSPDVPEGRACGNCFFYDESNIKEYPGGELRAYCQKWEDYVNGAYYCNAWQMGEETRAPVSGADKFTTEQEALDRAEEIGCEGTHTIDENGETIYMPCSTHAAYDSLVNSMDDDGDSYSTDEERAPAPKSEQIKGSDTNEPGSAKGSGADIVFSEATTTALKNKVTEHNEKMDSAGKPAYTKTRLGTLKSVYRRGSGAYSTSFRPGISRAAWSMARVNAFLYLLRNGRPENPKYITDYDLLPEGHPKSTRSASDTFVENRQVNLTPPAYMRASARRGLELNRDGFGGDGLTDKTKQEAREMAAGQVSEDKWRRIAPWIARHMVDLDAPSNRNPDDPGYPGAGLVAHLLWGSGPSKSSAERAMKYAQSVVDQLDKEQERTRWSSIAIQLDKKTKDEPVTKIERRVKTDVDFEIRLLPDGADGMRFTGYAAVFNSDSEPLPFTERIIPGAFKRSLKARNEIKMFVNHNMDMVLASTRAKTLKLTEDSKGLLAEAELPDTSYGRDLSVLMQRGDVNSMSFGFSVPKKGDRWLNDGAVRELLDIRLHEVSIVTGFPAYQATTAQVRSVEILASRTNTDPDQLADALIKLESGETLSPESADLITEVVTKLRADAPILGSFSNLDIKRKQLDLIYKAV